MKNEGGRDNTSANLDMDGGVSASVLALFPRI